MCIRSNSFKNTLKIKACIFIFYKALFYDVIVRVFKDRTKLFLRLKTLWVASWLVPAICIFVQQTSLKGKQLTDTKSSCRDPAVTSNPFSFYFAHTTFFLVATSKDGVRSSLICQLYISTDHDSDQSRCSCWPTAVSDRCRGVWGI